MIDSDARSAGDARRSREPDATGERLIHTAVEGRGEGGGEGAEGEGGGGGRALSMARSVKFI